jgi:hypothetical protein
MCQKLQVITSCPVMKSYGPRLIKSRLIAVCIDSRGENIHSAGIHFFNEVHKKFVCPRSWISFENEKAHQIFG